MADDKSLTIAQFCEGEQISLPYYFKIRKAGLGPVELRIGKGRGAVVRITIKSRDAWRAKMEKQK